jgi:hypothetical protein
MDLPFRVDYIDADGVRAAMNGIETPDVPIA